MHFDWDPDKASRNLRAHGVSFVEAREAWDDRGAREEFDVDHSDVESRWRRIGRSHARCLLVVVFTPRGDIIRIISARRASKRERHDDEVR